MASSTSSSTRRRTRSDDKVKEFDCDKDFPPQKFFKPPTKLPTVQSVICMIRYHLEKGIGSVTKDMAIREVTKQIYAKYYHDTVYCVSLTTIQRRIDALWKKFNEGRKRYGQKGKEMSKAVMDYQDLFQKKNELFDVYAEDPVRQQKLQEEWGVSMSEMEFTYYEDQKTERKMSCSKGVDPVWYHSMMRTQRLKERQEEYKRKRDEQFEYKSFEEITAFLLEAGEIPTTDEEEGGWVSEQLETSQTANKAEVRSIGVRLDFISTKSL